MRKKTLIAILSLCIIAVTVSGCKNAVSSVISSYDGEENGHVYKSKGKKEDSKSIWADGFTPIDDFDYYIDGDEIYIKDYIGNQNKIRISGTYEIDGNEMKVVSLTGAVFLFSDVESIIVSEGITSVSDNVFNSCGATFYYLPSTIEPESDRFWRYFHEVEKIYFGGTDEQWEEICHVDREDVETKQIICEADPDKLQ